MTYNQGGLVSVLSVWGHNVLPTRQGKKSSSYSNRRQLGMHHWEPQHKYATQNITSLGQQQYEQHSSSQRQHTIPNQVSDGLRSQENVSRRELVAFIPVLGHQAQAPHLSLSLSLKPLRLGFCESEGGSMGGGGLSLPLSIYLSLSLSHRHTVFLTFSVLQSITNSRAKCVSFFI